jgi:hypothetical protein
MGIGGAAPGVEGLQYRIAFLPRCKPARAPCRQPQPSRVFNASSILRGLLGDQLRAWCNVGMAPGAAFRIGMLLRCETS